MATGQKPIKNISAGLIKASIWSNKGKTKDNKEFTFLTCQLQRSYKVNDEWKHENINLRLNDLARVKFVLDEAFKDMVTKEKDSE